MLVFADWLEDITEVLWGWPMIILILVLAGLIVLLIFVRKQQNAED